MSGIQIVAVLFAGAMMYQSYLHRRRGDIGTRELALWLLVWGGLLLVSLVPGLFQGAVGIAHVARLLDLVMIVGMLVIGAVTYQLYVTNRRLERAVDRLIRELALSELEGATSGSGDTPAATPPR